MIAVRLRRASRLEFATPYEQGLARLGLLLLLFFLVDQIKIEFLRIELMDYTQFVFALFGMWLGLCERGREPGEVAPIEASVNDAATPRLRWQPAAPALPRRRS